MSPTNIPASQNPKPVLDHTPLRVIANRFPTVTVKTRAAISQLADDIRSSDPRIGDTGPFGPDVQVGQAQRPAILFGDTGEIPLVAKAGRNRFNYRMGWLVGPVDLVVVGGAVCPAFET